MDSDGFTVNWSTAATGQNIFVLCLKGGQYKAGAFLQKTSSGSQGTTGVGFQPTGWMNYSSGVVAGTTVVANPSALTVAYWAAASDATHRAVMFSGEGSYGRAELDRAAVYTHRADDSTPTLNAKADLTSFDSDGFTLNYGTADATAREIIYLAMGNAAAAAPPFYADRPRGSQRPFPFLPGSPSLR
jgi:hypothetical protein